ncbi:hypothetical protein DFH06DRAFT_1131503 [Mycena polygramma]|nr:hypothetical protein DFH06DRAFT_1131503 [Mycena polygramma]
MSLNLRVVLLRSEYQYHAYTFFWDSSFILALPPPATAEEHPIPTPWSGFPSHSPSQACWSHFRLGLKLGPQLGFPLLSDPEENALAANSKSIDLLFPLLPALNYANKSCAGPVQITGSLMFPALWLALPLRANGYSSSQLLQWTRQCHDCGHGSGEPGCRWSGATGGVTKIEALFLVFSGWKIWLLYVCVVFGKTHNAIEDKPVHPEEKEGAAVEEKQ